MGCAKLLDGFFDAPGAPQLVAAHVVGVGNRAGESQVGFAVLERFVGPADVFERVSKVMVRGGIIRRDGERGLVKGDGVHVARLAPAGHGSFVGKPAQNPKSRVCRISHQSVIDGFAIGDKFFYVLLVLEKIEQLGPDFQALTLGIAYNRGERAPLFQSGARCLDVVHGDVNVAESPVSCP